jgi:hypothetical protein
VLLNKSAFYADKPGRVPGFDLNPISAMVSVHRERSTVIGARRPHSGAVDSAAGYSGATTDAVAIHCWYATHEPSQTSVPRTGGTLAEPPSRRRVIGETPPFDPSSNSTIGSASAATYVAMATTGLPE